MKAVGSLSPIRIATVDIGYGPQCALVDDERVAPLAAMGVDMADARDFFVRWSGDLANARRQISESLPASAWLALDEARLLAPVLRPGKIVGIGRNYRAHSAEGALEPQEKPRVFFKTANAIAGPNSRVRRPSGITKLDYEAELVVVVGRTLHDASEAEAMAAIGGYTIGNDLSARELQFDVQPPQTSFAKSMDGFAPIGPWVVAADSLGASPNLAIRCWVNDELRQEGRTGDLIFPIATCLAYVSRFITLDPGDLLFTGTPAGVGAFRSPPAFLVPGDSIRVEIESIGALNTVVV